jgi:predicted nucleic acid-binding protein
MIVLDTNVVSEIMTGPPESLVLAWLSEQLGEDLRISVIAAAEITYGLARMPGGQKKDRLSSAWDGVVASWATTFLTVDVETARIAGEIQGMRSRAGRPLHLADAVIAATALRYGAALATRNTKDFRGLGLTLANPWES